MTASTSLPPELTAPDDDDAPASPPPTPVEIHEDSEPDAARGLATALLLVLLVAIALVVAPTIAALERPGPDEFYHLSYGKTLAERGLGSIREIFRAHVEESRHWQFPNPLRIGYLALAAQWMKWDGVSPQSLAHLSLVAHLASIVLVFRLALRPFGSLRALGAATLFASSPLLLGLSRRALQDSFATFAALVALAAFLAATERPSRARALRLALAFAFALTVKESLLLLAPPMALWLALEWRGGRLARRAALGAFAALAGAGLLALATWIAAAGSFDTVRRLAEIILRSPATNEYALRFGGGPWWRYAVDFVALSALPTLAGVAGLALAIERARREPVDRRLLFLALLTVVFLAESALLTKNVRYVALLELPLRLFAVEALFRLAPVRPNALRVAWVGAAVVALAALDVASFRELFIAQGLYDPMSAPLLELRGVVPAR